MMDKPVLFIGTNENGKLEVNEDAVAILQNIDLPVTVISITGKYRTGKSYLLNLLFGESGGFALGSTVQSKTKGIWMWCRPHPRDPNRGLVLLDTEGLSDPEKGDENHDNQIFALAVILSNCLVYNSMGTISDDAIRSLYFITSLTEHIKLQDTIDDESGVNFDCSFPSFVWVVRDFILDLEYDGKPCTTDEYLERSLQLKPGMSQKVRDYNLPRECIKSFFKAKKCFTLCKPVDDDAKLRILDELKRQDLKPQFVSQSDEFKDWALSLDSDMNVGGCPINGRRLLQLAKSYVSAIHNGAVPCVQSAVTVMGRNECERAIQLASAAYNEEMDRALVDHLPVNTEELSKSHETANNRAVKLYHANAMLDSDGQYAEKLQATLASCYLEYMAKNREISDQKCQALLQMLMQDTLGSKLKQGAFSMPGGYEKYKEDIDAIERKYYATEGKGPAAQQVWEKFLLDKKEQGEAILAGDKAMTAMEREKAELQQETKRREAELAASSQEAELLKQQIMDVENGMQTNMVQIKEEFEKKLKETEADYKALVEKREAELKDLQRSELKSQADMLDETIRDLKEERKNTRKDMEDSISELKSALKKRESQLAEISQESAATSGGGTGSGILGWVKDNPEVIMGVWDTFQSWRGKKTSESVPGPSTESSDRTSPTANMKPAGDNQRPYQGTLPGRSPPYVESQRTSNVKGDTDQNPWLKGSARQDGNAGAPDIPSNRQQRQTPPTPSGTSLLKSQQRSNDDGNKAEPFALRQPQGTGAAGNANQARGPSQAGGLNSFIIGRAGFARPQRTTPFGASPLDELRLRQRQARGGGGTIPGQQGNRKVAQRTEGASKTGANGPKTQ